MHKAIPTVAVITAFPCYEAAMAVADPNTLRTTQAIEQIKLPQHTNNDKVNILWNSRKDFFINHVDRSYSHRAYVLSKKGLLI